MDKNSYSFKVTSHSGENKFRVKQIGLGAIPRYSSNVVLNSMIEKPKFEVKENALAFSYETGFEVYDSYGLVVKKGFGK